MKDMKDKCVFISGGASGIGLAMASAFGRNGAKLIIADIDEDKLGLAAERLRAEQAEVLALRLDVACPASWQEAAGIAETAMGAVDILCNNAGVGSARASLDEISAEDWNWVFGINVHGVRNGIRTFLPRMKARGEPAHIVNTASILGLFAAPNVGDYVATKYAVLGLSEALRMELRHTLIGVSVLCPGLVVTPLSQNARTKRPSMRGAAQSAAADDDPPQRPPGVDPDQIGARVVEAVRDGRFYIFTHPEYDGIADLRFTEIGNALRDASPSDPPDDVSYLGKGVLAGSAR